MALRYNLREELCSHTNKEEEAVRAIWYQKIAEVGTFLFIAPDDSAPDLIAEGSLNPLNTYLLWNK